MNQSNNSISDSELRDSLAEFQERPVPSNVQTQELRAQILDRATLRHAATEISEVGRRSTSKSWLSVAASLTVAASLLLVASAFWFASSGGNAFAQALAVAHDQSWVHVTSLISKNGQSATQECWFSSKDRIAAMKSPMMSHFVDFESGIAMQYKSDANRIYKTRADVSRESTILGNIVDALLKSDGKEEMFPGHKVSDPILREFVKDGRRLRDCRFEVEHRTREDDRRSIQILIDHETELPLTWTEKHSNGRTIESTFEYPETGPSDLFALGVPKSTEVVDRVASSDVTKIAQALRTGRIQFDDYDAIYVQFTEGREFSPLHHGAIIRRIRRKGLAYRVDYLLSPMPELSEPPADEDLNSWWIENREKFWSVPMLVCDGKSYTTYRMINGRLPREGKPDLRVKAHMSNPVSGRPNDPTVVWEDLMTEYSSRPHLWTSVTRRSFEFEPVPDDGPENSVRVLIRQDDHPVTNERAKFFFSPEHGFCLTKSIQPVIRKDQGDPKLAYVNTEEYSNFAKSPKGHWYPQRCRRTTTSSKVAQIREFFLDFDVDLSDDLFDRDSITLSSE